MKRLTNISRILSVALLMQFAISVRAQHYIPIDGEISDIVTLTKLGSDSAYLVNEAILVAGNGELNIESGVRIYFAHCRGEARISACRFGGAVPHHDVAVPGEQG